MNDIPGNLRGREYPMVEAVLSLRSLVNVIEASVGDFAAKEEFARTPDLSKVCEEVAGQATQWLDAQVKFSQTEAVLADIEDLGGVLASRLYGNQWMRSRSSIKS